MLRLYDTLTGQVRAIEPARRRELRISTWGPPLDRPAHAGDLRTALLTDLIRRTAERRGPQVTAWLLLPGAGEQQASGDQQGAAHDHRAGFQADCAALNIHPPTYMQPVANQPGTTQPAAEPAASDLYITGSGEPGPGQPTAGRWVPGGPLAVAGIGAVPLSEVTGRGLDPLALRLALLGHRYREPLNISWAAIGEADRALHQWRGQVAGWADQPSKAMPSAPASALTAAFEDDLDTAAGLDVLRALAGDAGVPPGAKFEMFAHADHLLGLDLARDIGRRSAG